MLGNLLMVTKMHPQKFIRSALILSLSISALSAFAAGSMLRVSCEGDDVGAEVSINGKFKGECPAGVQVNEGTLKLLVRKKVDEQRERVFEQELRIGDGVVKNIEARLGAPQLNAAEKARQESAKLRVKKMSIAVLQKEAAAGNLDLVLELRDRYASGRDGATKDKELYNYWRLKGAEAGDVDSMYDLGQDNFSTDAPKAILWFKKAAELGHGPSMSSLGDLLSVHEENGQIKVDEVSAAQWYRKAAEAGETDAIRKIGMDYMTGSGVPKSWEQGVSWFRKGVTPAAYKNSPRESRSCMYWLGKAYENGWGVPRDEQQAIVWWLKATEGEGADKSAVKELQKRSLR